MFLGIEIGGTKLQLGVGPGDGSPLAALQRMDVDRQEAAAGIRRRIEQVAPGLIRQHDVKAIGIGFGGPVDVAAGRTIKSHQIDGWNDFPLVEWCRQTFGLPAAISNDADAAGLAEARFGAGRGQRVVFYITVGSGIGGALVIDGQAFRGGGGVAAEIGHLRPGLQADQPDQTVEATASGWGIGAAAQAWLEDPQSHPLRSRLFGARSLRPETVRQHLRDCDQAEAVFVADLRQCCGGHVETLSGKIVAQAASEGNELAQEIVHHAIQTLGWAIGQMITLTAPNVVVLGGGVPMLGEAMFFGPLRREVGRYVFPPLAETYRIVPAQLGEEVVVHGALAVATSVA